MTDLNLCRNKGESLATQGVLSSALIAVLILVGSALTVMAEDIGRFSSAEAGIFAGKKLAYTKAKRVQLFP